MPVITFDHVALDKETKAKIAKEMTEVAVRHTGLPAEAFYVFIREHDRENVSVGGTLLADRK